MTQRRQYRLLQQGKKSSITEERIAKLEEIGFVWDAKSANDDTWNQRYKELIEYKRKHGDCLVPYNYEPKMQLAESLGLWVIIQRTEYRLFRQGIPSSMTQERIDKLEDIGFKWWKLRG